jgi:hypothetical protein
MARVLLLAILALSLLAGKAQARDYFYRSDGSSLESEGYRLFASDDIIKTVDKAAGATDRLSRYCANVDETTSRLLGDIRSLHADSRLAIPASSATSYGEACLTYYSVLDRLTSADDIRRLWLVFADAATDDYAQSLVNRKGISEETRILVELRRLADVSKYIEYFSRNSGWRLSDYTFLSQAFRSRKGKSLSPAFSRFVAALLTGQTDNGLQVVKSVDLDDLGRRLAAPAN